MRRFQIPCDRDAARHQRRVAQLARELGGDVREYGYSAAREDVLRLARIHIVAGDEVAYDALMRAWHLVQSVLSIDERD